MQISPFYFVFISYTFKLGHDIKLVHGTERLGPTDLEDDDRVTAAHQYLDYQPSWLPLSFTKRQRLVLVSQGFLFPTTVTVLNQLV